MISRRGIYQWFATISFFGGAITCLYNSMLGLLIMGLTPFFCVLGIREVFG